MIKLDPPTKRDGQVAALQVACNRATRAREAVMQAQGGTRDYEELKVDDVMGPKTFDRANFLIDTYYHKLVSRVAQGTVTAGAVALIVGIEAIERDRLRDLKIEQMMTRAGQS